MGEVPFFTTQRIAPSSAELIGSSRVMTELRAAIQKVAASDATVLLMGPSGSGKENSARALHQQSERHDGPFVAVNCGAIPSDLAEAELFGAEVGAYTGATKVRIGRLEAANGGTLFLDEVGDLPLPLQVKLLRALETRTIERLGGGRTIPLDIRIIAATHVDLDLAVEEKRFREDLYWRLAVVVLMVPSLAQRLEDLPELVRHFAGRHEQPVALTECGLQALHSHDWAGNLRELRNLVDRSVALGEPILDAITIQRLLRPRRRPMQQWLEASLTTVNEPGREAQLPACLSPVVLKKLMAEAEASIISQVLERGGSVAQSARLLGMKRTTLVEKMRRIGLSHSANTAT